MVAITLELQDEVAERLAEEARCRNMSAEQLAAIGVENLLKESEAEFNRIVEEILKDNAELYRRLA